MENETSLTGKVALVTGSSRGIGRGIAQRLARAGATVVVTARSLDKAGEFAGTLTETVSIIEQAGGKAIALAADLDDAGQLDKLVPRVIEVAGRLDILVNNAGISEYSLIEDMPEWMFDQTAHHYLKVPFKLIQQAIPVMRQQGAGWIVCIGSVTAQRPLKPYSDFDKNGGASFYAAIKAALARFVQGLAAELERDNIAVNLAAPSTAISTPGADRFIPADYPSEPVEYLAETVLALCHLPAADRTGLLTHSLHFPIFHDMAVYTLDGNTLLPKPEIPDYAHPEVMPAGE